MEVKIYYMHVARYLLVTSGTICG